MRIGLLICGDLQYTSGGFLYDRMLVERLRGRGDEVETISLPWGGWRSVAANLDRGLIRYIVNSPFDLLLQDELAHPSLFLLNAAIRRAESFPVISIVHHLRSGESLPFWVRPAAVPAERFYLRSVDGFIFNSPATRASVENIGIMKPSVVARPGSDRFGTAVSPEEIKIRCLKQETFRILFVGNVIPRKGLHVLVSALHQLREEAWILTVAGDYSLMPSYTSKLKTMISRSGLGGRIRFAGRVDDGALAGLYANSHLLAVPSELEGFGIVYGEAGAFGVPSIAADFGAPAETIADEVDGFIVKAGDSSALAERIRKLLPDREKLLALSLAARKRFDTLPSWGESMAAAAGFLSEQAASHSGRRR
ncbi:MAG: glycosyltransferase family 4 protein [Syntrophales bacterium]|nr:glycosyltransferase family 4 protein [Syntrophales bacterium]MDD5533178.1 glycosyltransferase family 4 protein [Syntrophales bacterium]